MPTTTSYPFRRLIVDRMTVGITRIFWQFEYNFNEPGPFTFQLQRSHAGTPNASDWVDVGPSASDTVYLEDPDQHDFGKRLLTYYRVIILTGRGRYASAPVSSHGILTERDWINARDILRREQLRGRFVWRDGYILKRLRYGVRCTRCLDQSTGVILDSSCPECYGTGFKSGYNQPFKFCLELDPEAIVETRNGTEPPSAARETAVRTRGQGLPALSLNDVWVDAHSDQRWYVQSSENGAEIRGVPLISKLTITLAPFTDVIYHVPIDNSSADAAAELPGLGNGCIRVTHDYGGQDMLTYQDASGCGVVGATILALTRANYDNGLRDAAHAAAIGSTGADGRWLFALRLDPGEYVLIFDKTGTYGPDIVTLTVTAPPPGPGSSSSVASSLHLGSFGPT